MVDDKFDKAQWDGMQGETDKIALVNEAEGRPIILRQFYFALPPGVEKRSKEEVRTIHQQAIETFLWKDELVLVKDLDIIDDEVKGGFHIFATCQPRKGSELREKPRTLQDVLTKNDSGGNK